MTISLSEQADLDLRDAETRYFEQWLKDPDNRHVYRRFCYAATAAKEGGMKRWSARGIVHVLRYKSAVHDGDGMFKINNNITPMLARQAMVDHPQLEGFFEVRS